MSSSETPTSAAFPLQSLVAGLAPTPDLDVARRYILAYEPEDPDQQRARGEILAFLDEHPENAHLRSCLVGHLTASALVVDEGFERVLLLHHRKLGRWLQPGGHCDGDAQLAGVALREASEESGMDGLRVVPRIVDLDIHEIPPYQGVPAHLHLDSRFVVVAPRGAEPTANEESHELAFLPWDAALERADDASAERLIRVVRAIVSTAF